MPRRARIAIGEKKSVPFSSIDPAQLEEIRKSTNGNYVLGNDRFKEKIEFALKRRVTPGKTGRPKKDG